MDASRSPRRRARSGLNHEGSRNCGARRPSRVGRGTSYGTLQKATMADRGQGGRPATGRLGKARRRETLGAAPPTTRPHDSFSLLSRGGARAPVERPCGLPWPLLRRARHGGAGARDRCAGPSARRPARRYRLRMSARETGRAAGRGVRLRRRTRAVVAMLVSQKPPLNAFTAPNATAVPPPSRTAHNCTRAGCRWRCRTSWPD